MVESEWLSSDDPGRMLAYLQANTPPGGGRKPSGRKLRLFACACCRAVWPLLTDPCSRRAVEVAERYADGGVTDEQLRQAMVGAQNVVTGLPLLPMERGYSPYDAAADAMMAARQPPGLDSVVMAPRVKGQVALLRDVFGNPFCPAPSEPCTECAGGVVPTDRDDNTCPCCRGSGRRFPRRWRTPTVLRLARGIYAERDFAATPVLADALEDAGAEDAGLLGHLRGLERCPEADCPSRCCGVYPCPGWIPLRGPCVRGCHVLDLILGKE